MNRIVSFFSASFLAAALFALPTSGQERTNAPAPTTSPTTSPNSVKIWFRQSKINYVPSLHDNQQNLDSFTPKLDSIFSDKIHYRVRSIQFTGGASPEGSIRFNRWLSVKRAETLRSYLSNYVTFPDSLVTTVHLGRDWQGLRQRVLDDPNVPGRDAVLKLLDYKEEPLEELKGMRAYNYLYRKHFPELRASSLVIEYDTFPELLTAGLTSNAEFFNIPKIPPPIGLKSRLVTST